MLNKSILELCLFLTRHQQGFLSWELGKVSCSSQAECWSTSKLLCGNCTIPSSGEYKWLLEKAIQRSLERHKDFFWVQWGLGENAEIINLSNILFYLFYFIHMESSRFSPLERGDLRAQVHTGITAAIWKNLYMCWRKKIFSWKFK